MIDGRNTKKTCKQEVQYDHDSCVKLINVKEIISIDWWFNFSE